MPCRMVVVLTVADDRGKDETEKRDKRNRGQI